MLIHDAVTSFVKGICVLNLQYMYVVNEYYQLFEMLKFT